MTDLRMPAEWEHQAAIWLAWPHQRKDWPGKFPAIPFVYAEIIRHISESQLVKLVVRDKKMQASAMQLLDDSGADLENIRCYNAPTNRVWVRDSGPVFIRQGKAKIGLDWKFNAWAKYNNWHLDDKLPQNILSQDKLNSIRPTYQGKRVVLEGGAIDVNGFGALLTTEECLLSQDIQCRNSGYDKQDYEEIFAEFLGIQQIIWLTKGIKGDDTHGHVDDITRFVNKSTVVTMIESRKQDENHAILQQNRKLLRATRLHGRPLEVVDIPMPRPLYYQGIRVPASYANFLICNKIVLVPTFNDPADRTALDVLAQCFPDRVVVGIHAVDLVWGFGTLHCLSQQEPA